MEQEVTVEVCDTRSNNDVIAYFQMPIKQIFETESMTIQNQSFPLKGLSEPLDNVSIVLRLSLHVGLFQFKKSDGLTFLF